MNRPTSRSSATLLALAYLAFISLGLPDAVLGVAWPSVRDSFGLPQALLGAPLAARGDGLLHLGMLAGRLIQGLGIGLLLAGSTALVAAASWASPPRLPSRSSSCVAPFMGFGSGAIDAALNTYAARNFSPKHMSWLHAAYAAGAMAGPAIMTAVLSRGASWQDGLRGGRQLLAALAVAFAGHEEALGGGADRTAGDGRHARWGRPCAAGRAAGQRLLRAAQWQGLAADRDLLLLHGHRGLRWPVELHDPHRGARPRQHGGGDLGGGLLGRAAGGAARAGLRGRAGGAGPDAPVRDRGRAPLRGCSSPSPG